MLPGPQKLFKALLGLRIAGAACSVPRRPVVMRPLVFWGPHQGRGILGHRNTGIRGCSFCMLVLLRKVARASRLVSELLDQVMIGSATICNSTSCPPKPAGVVFGPLFRAARQVSLLPLCSARQVVASTTCKRLPSHLAAAAAEAADFLYSSFQHTVILSLVADPGFPMMKQGAPKASLQM